MLRGFDFDDILDLGQDILDGAVKATGSLAEKAVEVVKDEAPHIAHKAGEIIEEIAKKVK